MVLSNVTTLNVLVIHSCVMVMMIAMTILMKATVVTTDYFSIQIEAFEHNSEILAQAVAVCTLSICPIILISEIYSYICHHLFNHLIL